MWDRITDEKLLEPAAAVLALILFLLLLRKINKLLLLVGAAILTALYLLNNQPDWLKNLTDSFRI